MIISRQRSYVFVHIPKTGGTSLASALEDRAARDDLLIGDTPKAKRRRGRLDGLTSRGRFWKHSTLSDIDGVVSVEEIARMFTFTLVRNPWDRLLSYYHWARAQDFDHPAVHLARHCNFADFLSDYGVQESIRTSPARQYMQTVDGAERCSLYIRLEHFDRDVQPLWEHLGFEVTLPHLNPSDRDAGYANAYSDQTRAIVADICAEDIDRFGYRFE